MAYITRGLLEVLLTMAEDADPDGVSIRLAVTPADELELEDDLDPETPVFTDLYFPSSGDSVAAVFGVDVSVPPGQTPGRFISHPMGDPSPNTTDDFAERLFIAVPPYEVDDVTVYDRRGRRQGLVVVETAAAA